MEFGRFIEIVGSINCSGFRFLTKAISDDDTRYFMNFAYCEDNKLIATDGRRLHILELGENFFRFKDKTFYRALKATGKAVWFAELSEDPGQFPNWKRVIPDTKGWNVIEYISKTKMWDSSIEIAKLLRAIPESLAINMLYLNDLSAGRSWKTYISDENKALVFESDCMTAIIMPLQND